MVASCHRNHFIWSFGLGKPQLSSCTSTFFLILFQWAT